MEIYFFDCDTKFDFVIGIYTEITKNIVLSKPMTTHLITNKRLVFGTIYVEMCDWKIVYYFQCDSMCKQFELI